MTLGHYVYISLCSVALCMVFLPSVVCEWLIDYQMV